MQTIQLEPIPNQSLNVRLDGSRYVIELKEAGGMMAVTIDRDGVRLVTGFRCPEGIPLIPYLHLFSGFGNFVFVSEGIPYYPDFGATCSLVYASVEEISAAV
jgi:hypothetical protein